MIRIGVWHNGYEVRLDGDRKRYRAANIGEAVNALLHYHGQRHAATKCPLCRSIRAASPARGHRPTRDYRV